MEVEEHMTSNTTASNDNTKRDTRSDDYNGDSHKGFATSYRILVVDDDPDILITFKKGLEEQVDKSRFGNRKIQVDTHSSPKQALSSFKADVYDLLMLDIRMPDINGFELYRELSKIDDKPKVCFITAYELYYDALKKDFPGLDVGCFIKKPISIEDLAAKIREELA
jgi:DNA-binding response OmpR family regulator